MKRTVKITDETREFLNWLPGKERDKVNYEISLLEELGLEYPHLKHIEGKLWEMKIKSIRLFYCLSGKGFLILNGYVKKSQKTPKAEKERALKIMRDYA